MDHMNREYTDHRYFMSLALEEARLAPSHGDVPVGAVLVRDQTVLSRAHNRREADQDPTAHAEILALRAAGAFTGNWRLNGTSLYVTLEPCPMCACALVEARVSRLVYGAEDPALGAAGSLLNMPQFPGFKHHARIIGGIRAKESEALLQGFFRERRGAHG
jgi:tRNA(adenine34) deaminase